MAIIIFIMKSMEFIHKEIRQLALDHIANKWWKYGGIKYVKKNHTGLKIRCCLDCVKHSIPVSLQWKSEASLYIYD